MPDLTSREDYLKQCLEGRRIVNVSMADNGPILLTLDDDNHYEICGYQSSIVPQNMVFRTYRPNGFENLKRQVQR